MHHERALARSVFGDIFQAEALRQVEIELHSRELPEAADGVDQLDIDFRAVECSFARDDPVFDIQFL